jgi:diguanylate cyclase (GGDEF)-like protein
MILRTIADSFLPEEDWGHNGPTVRRKRVYVLINLFLIGVHCYALAAVSLSDVMTMTNSRLTFNAFNIVFCISQLICVRRNVRFDWLAMVAQQYYTVVVIVYIAITGSGASQSVPWLVVLPVACMLFLIGWKRYASIAIWFAGALMLLFLQDDPSQYSLIFWAICAGFFGAFVSTVGGQLYADDEVLLANLANTDPLTGVLNRRGLVLGVNQFSGGSLLVFDLDDFKRVNDQHGHEAGDLLLIELCQRLNSSLRKTDRVARVGGEEFAVWFGNASLADAVALAERLKQKVTGTPFVVGDRGLAVSVTFSGGLLQHSGERSITKLMNACDKLLYKAKESGKNTIVNKPPR